jgi:hypothetical protein
VWRRVIVATFPKKVGERLVAGLKRFQPVLASAKARDVNESDTVIIITDMLAEVFGYDKYSEITSEHSIRGTFCDLAIKLDGVLRLLIEVKAIGLDLKEQYIKQAIDYAANQGTDWVLLTNGDLWRVYKVTFDKPIGSELVMEFTLSQLNPKEEGDLEMLFRLSKEGWQKSALGDFHEQRQALSRFFLGAVVVTDPVLDVVRRELRRMSPDVRIENEQIREVLLTDVLKRDVVEGEKVDEAKKKLAKALGRVLRAKASKSKDGEEAGPDLSPVGPAEAPLPTPEAPSGPVTAE